MAQCKILKWDGAAMQVSSGNEQYQLFRRNRIHCIENQLLFGEMKKYRYLCARF